MEIINKRLNNIDSRKKILDMPKTVKNQTISNDLSFNSNSKLSDIKNIYAKLSSTKPKQPESALRMTKSTYMESRYQRSKSTSKLPLKSSLNSSQNRKFLLDSSYNEFTDGLNSRLKNPNASKRYSTHIEEMSKSYNKLLGEKPREVNQRRTDSQTLLVELLDRQYSLYSPSKIRLEQLDRDSDIRLEDLTAKKEEPLKEFSQQELWRGKTDEKHLERGLEKVAMHKLNFTGSSPVEKLAEAVESSCYLLEVFWDSITLEDKIVRFIELVEDPRRDIRLGAVASLYLILRKFSLGDDYRELILDKCLALIYNYEIQEEIFLSCCLELISLFGPNAKACKQIALICIFLTDSNFPYLQKASFNCLMSLGKEGLSALIELASREYKEYQEYILSSLLRTPHIQRRIIVKALLNELYSGTTDRRHIALAALNRMWDLASDKETLDKLSRFIQDPKLDKLFLCSVIRTAGPQGEETLIKEVKSNREFAFRIAALSCLTYRIPLSKKHLDIRLDLEDTYSITNNPPGMFCEYIGDVKPVVLKGNHVSQDFSAIVHGSGYAYDQRLLNCDKGGVSYGVAQEPLQSQEYLLVCKRDFLAALKRMIQMDYDHSDPILVHDTLNRFNYLDYVGESLPKKGKFTKFRDFLASRDPEALEAEASGVNTSGELLLSGNIIKAISSCLSDNSNSVRETACSAIGHIGIPEGLSAAASLLKRLDDQDANVVAKAIWALGVLAPGLSERIIPAISSTLTGVNLWKVKCACLCTIAAFGSRGDLACPVLVKMLLESQLNKQIIAETLVKTGAEGETVLLKILNKEDDSKNKLKASIAYAFALSRVDSLNFDFILETLFKYSANPDASIRKACLSTILVLFKQAKGTVTYLETRNIIPLFYKKLSDKEKEIRDVRFLK